MKGYSETLDYLYGLEKSGIVLGLDHVRRILSLIGDPHKSLRAVHIAGTNGKGSVAAMVSEIAKRAGYRVGLYTSPHLVSFDERITINGVPISEREVVELTQFIREPVEAAVARGGSDAFTFTFFDFTTALAFEYFKRKVVDLAVVEVGLGGRLDSTNVLLPLISVITNVALDHQDYLGDTIEAIAGEKAGIIKEGVPIVTGAQGEALEVIRMAASKSDLYALGDAFSYSRKSDRLMSYAGIEEGFDDLAVNLRGDHQLFNASLVLCVIELLGRNGFVIEERMIREGLASVHWAGRLDLITGAPGEPSILLDGAHNPDGARALAAFLKTHFVEGKRILVFGVMRDKDFAKMLSELSPMFDRIILTRPTIERAADPADVAAYASGAMVTEAVGEALEAARIGASPNDVIVVAGSFYTIGEAKKLLHEKA